MEQGAGFPVLPMRRRGVNAIAWRLYSGAPGALAGFLAVAAGPWLALVWGAEALLTAALSDPSRIGSVPGGYRADVTAVLALLLLAFLFVWLLHRLWPRVNGVLYAACACRMTGRPIRLSSLLAARRDAFLLYRTTHRRMRLSAAVGALLLGGVVVLVWFLVRRADGTAAWLAAAAAALGGGFWCLLYALPFRFVFPAMVNEHCFGTAAIRRSFTLSRRHFGRTLACYLFPSLLTAAVVAAVSLLPYLYLPGDGFAASLLAGALAGAVLLLAMPYFAALDTALYFDAIARERAARIPPAPAEPTILKEESDLYDENA